MKQNIFKSISRQIGRFFHRLLLWTKPAYLRHRTVFQKQFDLKLQYSFLGCLIGVLLVATLFIVRPISYMPKVEDRVDMMQEDQDFDQEEGQKMPPSSVLPLQGDDQPIIQSTLHTIKTISLTLKKNETLSGLLKRAGLSMQEALNAAKSLDFVFDVRKIRAGQTFELFFLDEDDTFVGLKTENAKGDMVSVLKNKKGEFIPQSKEGIIENKYFVLDGVVETNFSVAAKEAHIPNSVVHQVIRALDGQIDFSKDLKTGDRFKVLYEQKMTDTGKEVGKSQLLYVALTTAKATHQRYFFIDAMGVQGFYNEKGASSPQVLLQRPLGRGRISSNFGMRLHPILGYQIQHNGIDFPAKIGTPVPAGADGVIQKIGRNGGYGKYIRIKHNNTYSTAYGHMDAFQPDLRVGSYVKKGETIGYVGNTGRSTGPHLHYEVIKNGKAVTPLKTYTIPQRVLKNDTLLAFRRKKAEIDALIQAP